MEDEVKIMQLNYFFPPIANFFNSIILYLTNLTVFPFSNRRNPVRDDPELIQGW